MCSRRVCIITVTWNKAKEVVRLLQSLENIDYPMHDIVVVDNNSKDDTVDRVGQKFPDVHLIRNRENLGGAGGFNAGLHYALARRNPYDYVWLLDNDVTVSRESLKWLVETLNRCADAAACGSLILKMGSNEVQEWGGLLDWKKLGIVLNHGGDTFEACADDPEVVEVDYCAACSLLVRVEDIRRFDVMDQEMFVFWDDIEWCTRFKENGRKILADRRSVVWHEWSGESLENLSDLWRTYYEYRNRTFFYANHGNAEGRSRRRKVLVRKALLFRFALRCLGLDSHADAVRSALSDFIGGVRGKWTQGLDWNRRGDELRRQSKTGLVAIFHQKHYSVNIPGVRFAEEIVWKNDWPVTRKLKSLWVMLTRDSIFIGAKVQTHSLAAGYFYLACRNGPVVMKNEHRLLSIACFLIYAGILWTASMLPAPAWEGFVSHALRLNH